MAQWLRAQTALAENLSTVPGTGNSSQLPVNSGSEHSHALFWNIQILHSHAYTVLSTQTPYLIKRISLSKKLQIYYKIALSLF